MVRVVGGPNSDPNNGPLFDKYFLEFQLMYIPENKK